MKNLTKKKYNTPRVLLVKVSEVCFLEASGGDDIYPWDGEKWY